MLPQNYGKEVPYVGMVLGPYCGFKVLEFDGRTSEKVVSAYKDTFEWWPKRSLEAADCRPANMGVPEHEVPDEKHTCGFYMYYEIGDAITNAHLFRTARPVVCEFVALVAAWGKVIHHQRGLRSSRMEVLAIHDGPYDFKGKLKDVAELMGIPYLKTPEILGMAKESGAIVQRKE
jgi:hypothetical protein